MCKLEPYRLIIQNPNVIVISDSEEEAELPRKLGGTYPNRRPTPSPSPSRPPSAQPTVQPVASTSRARSRESSEPTLPSIMASISAAHTQRIQTRTLEEFGIQTTGRAGPSKGSKIASASQPFVQRKLSEYAPTVRSKTVKYIGSLKHVMNKSQGRHREIKDDDSFTADDGSEDSSSSGGSNSGGSNDSGGYSTPEPRRSTRLAKKVKIDEADDADVKPLERTSSRSPFVRILPDFPPTYK